MVGDTPPVIPCPKHKAHMGIALSLKPGHAFPRHTPASPSQTRRVLEPPTSFSGIVLQGWHVSFLPFKVRSYRCFCVTGFGELPQISLERGINKPNQRVKMVRPGTVWPKLPGALAALLEAAGPRTLARQRRFLPDALSIKKTPGQENG